MDEGDFWNPEKPGPCWVCGGEADTAYLDLAYQHQGCEAAPTEDGLHLKILGRDASAVERIRFEARPLGRN